MLARGYAVCWNADRTAIIRRATAVAAGERVRVTLQDGEIECEVGTQRQPVHLTESPRGSSRRHAETET